MNRLLVCGGRHWDDVVAVEMVLEGWAVMIDVPLRQAVLMHGNAPGADTIAKRWGERNRADVQSFPAEWRPGGVYDPGAGPKRNQRMLDAGPTLVIAFKDNLLPSLDKGGTEDMVKRAKRAGVRVLHVDHP